MFGAVTWIGFMLTAVGWAMLLSAEPALVLFANFTGRNLASLTNLATIAQCTIITGLGIAIVGALRTGFSALKNFFDTILERTAPRIEIVPDKTAPVQAVASSAARVQTVASGETRAPVRQVEQRQVQAQKQPVTTRREPPVARPSKIIERGRLKDRGYVLFGDGSVEVETLLGLRRFASLGEAHKFIG